MKIDRFKILESTGSELTSEMIDFTEWCLIKNLENRRYFYNKSKKTWYDDMDFKEMTWEEIYLIYKSEKYNL